MKSAGYQISEDISDHNGYDSESIEAKKNIANHEQMPSNQAFRIFRYSKKLPIQHRLLVSVLSDLRLNSEGFATTTLIFYVWILELKPFVQTLAHKV